jgi:zinc transport system substrate-binding protein
MPRLLLSLSTATLAWAGAAGADVPVVVTDIPAVHALTANVMGELGSPVLLLEPGADAHDYQLRPSQAAALAEAGLVVWVGPAMTPWLDRALDSSPAHRLTLLDDPATVLRRYADSDDGHDHAAEDSHDDDHAAAGAAGDEHAAETADGHAEAKGHDHDHDHAHSGTDPHAWLSPANATTWLSLIAAELAELDPANAATYGANAAAEAARIAALDAELRGRLAGAGDRPIVVFHDAYGYFADHYGLTIAATLALGDAADPGAARIAAVQAKLPGAACIFPEAGHDPQLTEQIAADAGARVGAALDPEGRGLAAGAALYRTLMGNLGAAIADCLTGV